MSNEEKIVKFYWSTPRDLVAMTHGGQFPVERYPAGIPNFVGTPVENQLAMLGKVFDENGREVGVMSELEVFGRNGEQEYDVHLTVSIPGRGALFATQVKHFDVPNISEPYRTAAEKGEWHGHVETIHTSGPLPERFGKVIGGTGEFAGVRGRHQQTAIYKTIQGDLSVVDVCENFHLTWPE